LKILYSSLKGYLGKIKLKVKCNVFLLTKNFKLLYKNVVSQKNTAFRESGK